MAHAPLGGNDSNAGVPRALAIYVRFRGQSGRSGPSLKMSAYSQKRTFGGGARSYPFTRKLPLAEQLLRNWFERNFLTYKGGYVISAENFFKDLVVTWTRMTRTDLSHI